MRIQELKTNYSLPDHYISPLSKPIYVLRFGWRRMKPQTKVRWLLALSEACEESIRRIEEDLYWEQMRLDNQPKEV